MDTSRPKTDQEHLDFLRGLSALMVRFALDWMTRHPGTSFAQALIERTFFVNLGAWHRGEIYDNPEVEGEAQASWQTFLSKAEALSPGSDAEAAILNLLPPDEAYFGPRINRDQAELHHPVRGLASRSGCLWTFALPGALSLRARALGYAGIGTRTWLNDVAAWRACFPEVWTQRLTPQDFEAVGGHLGCWGQVVTARQTLSSHANAFVRTHGRFEYAMRASWMTVEEALG